MYCIVSPVRNEADHLPGTIQSMARQSILPAIWVLVDDGSTDATGKLIDEAAAQFSWIRGIHRRDRGFRKAGTGVMEAFYDGHALVEGLAWEFLVKLDGDLSFEPDYFQRCFERFAKEPKLGVGGGTVCRAVSGGWEPESPQDPRFHVRGATKIYRRACWEAIGGLIRQTGWDTLDEVKANMLDWSSLTFPEIRLLHHRPAGGADGNWKNWFKNGLANYAVGYHPLFMAAKCARRVFERPYGLAAVALWSGFLGGYLKGSPRAAEPRVMRYLREQQMNRLLGRQSLWG